MTSNIRFLAARRRNEQKKRGAEFLRELSKKTELPSDHVHLLEPQYSVELEQVVYKRLRAGIQDGAIPRIVHLTLEQAIHKCRKNIPASEDRDVDVLFCRYPDFPIRCKLVSFIEKLPRLIALDGETVTAVIDEGRTGVCLDVETETPAAARYELDFWGDWALT